MITEFKFKVPKTKESEQLQKFVNDYIRSHYSSNYCITLETDTGCKFECDREFFIKVLDVCDKSKDGIAICDFSNVNCGKLRLTKRNIVDYLRQFESSDIIKPTDYGVTEDKPMKTVHFDKIFKVVDDMVFSRKLTDTELKQLTLEPREISFRVPLNAVELYK